MSVSIIQAPFGQLADGRQAKLFTLRNANGIEVKISDFGGIVTSILAPDRDGRLADICLGFDSLAQYVEQSSYFGALIGRCGNRIGGAAFMLDGACVALDVNDGANHLHGGSGGFHQLLWQARAFHGPGGAGLALSTTSADGDQGYPGTLQVSASYTLNDDNELLLSLRATTDKATPVNLTHHAYFNLAGSGDILGHRLQIEADAITPVGPGLIPTGQLLPVAGTPFDFRQPHAIGERIGDDDPQLAYGQGYDHNFVLRQTVPRWVRRAARVVEPVSGRTLEVLTDQPGLQFYSGNFLDGSLTGKGQACVHRGGFCLEPQHFPDAPNQPGFPGVILRPGQQYRTDMHFRLSVSA